MRQAMQGSIIYYYSVHRCIGASQGSQLTALSSQLLRLRHKIEIAVANSILYRVMIGYLKAKVDDDDYDQSPPQSTTATLHVHP